MCIAVKDTEQLYNTDSTRLCRKRKGVACWWDMASCPQTDYPPLSFALCKELLASQTQGLFSSITRSVCPTLASWVQPTSCCGDVCVGACKVGDTDVCVMGGQGQMLLETSSSHVLPASLSGGKKIVHNFAPVSGEFLLPFG